MIVGLQYLCLSTLCPGFLQVLNSEACFRLGQVLGLGLRGIRCFQNLGLGPKSEPQTAKHQDWKTWF